MSISHTYKNGRIKHLTEATTGWEVTPIEDREIVRHGTRQKNYRKGLPTREKVVVVGFTATYYTRHGLGYLHGLDEAKRAEMKANEDLHTDWLFERALGALAAKGWEPEYWERVHDTGYIERRIKVTVPEADREPYIRNYKMY